MINPLVSLSRESGDRGSAYSDKFECVRFTCLSTGNDQRGCLNIKSSSYHYSHSQCEDKTVSRPSYIYNIYPNTGKDDPFIERGPRCITQEKLSNRGLSKCDCFKPNDKLFAGDNSKINVHRPRKMWHGIWCDYKNLIWENAYRCFRRCRG